MPYSESKTNSFARAPRPRQPNQIVQPKNSEPNAYLPVNKVQHILVITRTGWVFNRSELVRLLFLATNFNPSGYLEALTITCQKRGNCTEEFVPVDKTAAPMSTAPGFGANLLCNWAGVRRQCKVINPTTSG